MTAHQSWLTSRSASTDAGTYGAQVGIVNHTDKYIYSAVVAGAGGGHADAYSAGIANICCVTLPEQWQPGLKLRVRWDMPLGRTHSWREKTVDVERYDEPGSLYLHVFPDDSVRLVVTNWYGSSSRHPIPAPVAPGTHDTQPGDKTRIPTR